MIDLQPQPYTPLLNINQVQEGFFIAKIPLSG